MPPFEDDSNYGTPLAAGHRRSGADISASSSRKATPSRVVAGPTENDGATQDDGGVFSRFSRTLYRYFRYGQAIVTSINALLAIKTYRYLLGGKI